MPALTLPSSVPTEEQLAIHGVLIRYSMGIDGKDWELFATCFTEDCTARYGELVYDGRDALTRSFEQLHAPLDNSMHRLLNFAITAYGDGAAHTRSYCDALLVRASAPDGDLLQVVGFYEDDLVRGAGGWQIAHRDFRAVRYEGNFDVISDPEIARQGYADARAGGEG